MSVVLRSHTGSNLLDIPLWENYLGAPSVFDNREACPFFLFVCLEVSNEY